MLIDRIRTKALELSPRQVTKSVELFSELKNKALKFTRFELRESFSGLVRYSRQMDKKNPLEEEVRYRLESDKIFGELPVFRPKKNEMMRGLPRLIQWNLAAPRIEPVFYKSVEEAQKDAFKFFNHLPDPEVYMPDDKHLGDEWLLYMICTKYSYWLKNYPSDRLGDEVLSEPAYMLDLEYLKDLNPGVGYERHGGNAIFTKDKILGIILHGHLYTPKDPTWEVVKYKFRATSFAWITLLHACFHLREAAKLFTATHECLPTTHPLRHFLLPYIYSNHRNVARLQRTVIGNKGVTALVAGFESGDDALALILEKAGIRLCPEIEVRWPEHCQDMLKLWSILHKNVSNYIALYRLDPKNDACVKNWLQYLGRNIHPRLFTRGLSEQSDLSLADVLTYEVFVMSVLHYGMGHVLNGTTDPRFLCSSIRETKTPEDIWSVVSARDECLIRIAVYATIHRHAYRLTDDFSHLCIDPRGQAIVKNLAKEMREMARDIKIENEGKIFPRFLDPDAISSSAVL